MTRIGRLTIGMAFLLAAMATPAAAQYSAPPLKPQGTIGESYHIQASAGLWSPGLIGVISSEQFGLAGSKIDFVTDLKFQQTRFADFRVELRPSKRNKLFAQYTPISYSSDTTLSREIIFNGQKFTANLPIKATFDWKVLRAGYELDIISMERGFIGAIIEARITDFGATLTAPATAEFTRAKAPLPAYGGIARAYILPRLAVTASATGFSLPQSLADKLDATGNYLDIDIYATFNLNNYIGIQGGWRKMTTTVTLKKDFGDMEYKGIWFGGVVRY